MRFLIADTGHSVLVSRLKNLLVVCKRYKNPPMRMTHWATEGLQVAQTPSSQAGLSLPWGHFSSYMSGQFLIHWWHHRLNRIRPLKMSGLSQRKRQRESKAGSRQGPLWKFHPTWLSNPLKSLLDQNLWSWDNDDEVHFAEVAEVQALAAAVCYGTHLGQEFSGNRKLRLINLEGFII